MGDERGAEPDGLACEVVACVERTLAASSARIEYRRNLHIDWTSMRVGPRRRGGLLRPVGKVAKAGAKAAGAAAWRHLTKDMQHDFLFAEGYIEPAARRYMLDFSSYAEIHKDGERWGGRSGRPLVTLAPWPRDRQVDIWWLLDALRGTTDATVDGVEPLHDATCRRLEAHVDLDRASAAAGGGLSVPSVARVEDLHALPITVWIDGQHVRRVRFQEGREASTTFVLDLYDFDAGTGELDWERLPSFRSPAEAALVAGEREPELSERILARIFKTSRRRT
jgi:hypothetical protein